MPDALVKNVGGLRENALADPLSRDRSRVSGDSWVAVFEALAQDGTRIGGFDDAGSCPGLCSSPDDIGCNVWYRSSMCAQGDLCCAGAGLDAGKD